MTYGIQCFNSALQMTFDSSQEHTQFLIDERAVSVADARGTNGQGLSLVYPSYAGQKLSAVLASPYSSGDIQGYAIQSARVTYDGNGIPTVRVFYDNINASQFADGYLLVFATGYGAASNGTYGGAFYNQNGIMNISDTMKSYVYLGKYTKNWYGAYDFYLDVTCVGFPVCFFNVPYGTTYDSSATSKVDRIAVMIRRIQSLGNNQWRIYMAGNHPNSGQSPYPFNVTIRVFGRLDLNYPNGMGDSYGIQIRDASGNLTFDSSARMLRLAGNTYDVEIALSKDYFETSSNGLAQIANPAQLDTVVNLPFDMGNKSICAGTRGTVTSFYQTGSYYDPGAGYYEYTYDFWTWASGYWSNGNTLTARKFALEAYSGTVGGGIGGIDSSGFQTVYTRLSVIDNNLFP